MRLDALPLAMSYLPMQKWENLYDPEVGLDRGTIFACLDLPFTGKEGKLYGDV
ncbi:MAG TPA: spore coat associated protein CotJA [Candidatus Faecivivens stercoravium]|uniref:Spore coat associated protein CotJA n=1 Tax=Candidatus Faecivivens stercoravium TaxID=2840803 RepID=A0A9D1DWA4_9FIRM|nr:spore coat associated protein CotJA [Candidatus Faecivivens stercoravium]